MECADYRRRMLAEPQSVAAEVRLHAANCEECARYTERLTRFESRLQAALRVGIKLRTDNVVALRPGKAGGAVARGSRRTWVAAAASVLLGAVIAGSLWVAAPGRSLAAEVVGHMAGEPQAWARTANPVPEPELETVLGQSGVRLKAEAGLVTYASGCQFRGHLVPHLVVQTATGPVTVMLLTHESVRSTVRFDEQGYRGLIVPIPQHGSLAVLARGATTEAEAADVAARVKSAIEWLPQKTGG